MAVGMSGVVVKKGYEEVWLWDVRRCGCGM